MSDLEPPQPPTEPVAVVTGPPVQLGPPPRDPWPSSAKGTVLALAVLALVAIIAAVIGFAQASSDDDDDGASREELVAALARADEAEARLAELEASMDEELESLRGERDMALIAAEGLQGEVDELTGVVDELAQENGDLRAIIDAGAETFPVTVAPDLPTADLEGQYSVAFSEVRCDGLDQCGSTPTLPDVSLARSGDALLFNVPGVFEIPLTGRSAQLFGLSEDQTIVGPCADQPRPQRMRIAISGANGDVAIDGTFSLTGLTASIVVEAPEFGECAAGAAWYGATLTRLG